jgi:acyl transferase domain-containing protein/NAD(P)H-dependent flavin oxidoreductase YrpB (nitropropane dioxygenase family)/NADP-dependent 3-hydroxy acid dehydrogenase YdfG/acyl carrier protein
MVRELGVRVPDVTVIDSLPPQVTTVIVTTAIDVARFLPRRVLVQVTSLDEARSAIAAGASGVIAKGCEAGGRIGDETTFVLVQRLVGELDALVWAQGGIGEHTAAACIAGGAAGVVLDTQLALVRESSLPADIQAAIGAMDGSETVITAGHRVYTRPDLPIAQGAAFDESRLGGDSLVANFLPIGQDGAIARGLAKRYVTAGQLVRGIRASIADHLALAASHQPLAPDSPFAAAHGLRYPIAQGPMSRVSDRARFAEAVAAAGGLPFLALTLMTGTEVRDLLTETKKLLGDRPWGVGILGFVPHEIREQQLEVMREIAPPIALIAGGRPSQAHPLDAQGTATYLHVPSPGLLDLFLRDGARRFVFEGSECGGHVGPRTSFALWEAQIARLLEHPAPAELSVLFAGGIHDARSAAMVAAMAAPLAARGARIGVLMGTAYLFTHEAVAGGAIELGFQQAALACDRTVLLETSPGHSTRCASTEYVDAFAGEKQRLTAAGVATKEMWATLEQLNLGRLRIAAKGLRREGDQIAPVDAATQQREGMYMIGQVAALRRATCSVAELHHQVSVDGSELLAAVAARHEARAEVGSSRGVAVIGLAAIFPGAPDTDAFWANIVAGKNAIREVPPERWSVETYYDPAAVGANAAVGKKTPCKWGGFLDDVPFDPLSYGIPPKSLGAIEPVQLLSLEIARRALADAGYADRAFDRERTAVIFGAEAGTDLSSAYNFRAMFPQWAGPLPEALDAALPTLSEDSFPGVLSNVIAGRIANRLDLGGVNFTVDAACAASLAALDMAVKELVSGSSDMVLCGGADLHNGINDYLLFSSVHALSPTGQCHTFDASADGIVLGEGVACIVLKRLADAERDGDRIYAVIKGVAGASDGKSLGLTAPRKDGQVRALDRAYRAAGVSPAAVGLVEAHGTGTIVGDRTELATLTEVFTRAGAGLGGCVLGSVKSQIGHTKCAAGMAGLIKASLAIHHGVLPPTSNIKQPNPAWQAATSPFVFLDQARPWAAEHRVAAVSAFGFGGTNFHAVLTSHRDEVHASDAQPLELVLAHGADRGAAIARIEKLLASEPRLRDLARTACGDPGTVQVAIVADSLADLRTKLAAARDGRLDRGGALPSLGSLDHPAAGGAVAPEIARNVMLANAMAGKLAFVCPGQGSQKPGMLADLFVAFPRLHRWLELGAKWVPKMFPPAAFTKESRAAQAEALTDTRVAQPALGIADLAVADLLQSLGVRPDMVAGHSYGELAALCIAGALGDADLLALSEARGEHILAAVAGAASRHPADGSLSGGGADPGTMAAVAADADAVAPIIAGSGAVIANHNSSKQCVLSGGTAAIEDALARVKAAGLAAKRIPVACAFHSPLVAGASDTFAERLATTTVHEPRIPVYSNVTAAPYPPGQVRALLAAQIAKPVRFAHEIEAMYADGARIFVETGPGQVLTRLVAEILGDRPHLAVAIDGGLLRALATLAAAGVAIDLDPLFWDRDAAILEADAVPGKQATWLVNGHTSRPANEAPMKPIRPMLAAAQLAAAGAASRHPAAGSLSGVGAAPAERDGVVIEYLRNMRSMITAQRDVMLSYLGTVPAPMLEAPERAYVAKAIDVVEAPAQLPAPAQPSIVDPMQLVISIVSERTGYPIEMLGVDLDLEADLSIDSIKRIEIIGELAERLGLRVENGAGDADAIVEELATRKTLRALVAWLTDRLAKDAPPATAPAAVPSEIEEMVTTPTPATSLRRYRLEIRNAPAPINGHSTFAGQRFAIFDGADAGAGAASRHPAAGPVSGFGLALGERLRAEGAHVRHVGVGDAIALPELSLDGYVDLAVVDGVSSMRAMFERVREAAIGGAKQILVATMHGELGRAGAGGPAGLVKTVAAEWPGIKARVVDIEPGSDIAAVLHDELHAADAHVEIGYVGGVRSCLEVVPAELEHLADIALDANSVVLITGGARGITAKAAIGLVRRYGCKIELVGRSPLPGDEDPALASATDTRALRALLAKQVSTPGLRPPTGEAGRVPPGPAEIEALCTRVLADREIRATLAALGDRATYHVVDVRTPAFGELIDELYRRYGRIDGAIHGAGILEDKLMRHKTGESFERVFATKLSGARTLVERLRDDVRLVVLFSSISGAFGNRGQADYAAAGDALDKLAWTLQRKIAGRVVSIDWGPWSGGGMAVGLEREYARRGIGLIDPAHAVEALLAELGGGRDAQVILTATDPRTLRSDTERAEVRAEPDGLS